jgi:hypothetical protein
MDEKSVNLFNLQAQVMLIGNTIFLYLLVKRIISIPSYQVHSSGLETPEFMYQPTKWKKEYRFVPVRHLIPEDPTE